MKEKYLKPYWWVIRTQWHTARGSFIWTFIYGIYSGVSPIITTYAVAQLITEVSRVALQQGSTSTVYFWLVVILIIEILSLALNNFEYFIRVKFQNNMELYMFTTYAEKMYQLSQEQYDDQGFNTKLERGRDALTQIWRIFNESTNALSSFISFIASLIAIVVIAPFVGILITAAVVPAVIIQIRNNRNRELAYKEVEPLDRVSYRSRWMLIDPNSMPEIRLMNAFGRILKIWRTYTKKSQDIYLDIERKIVVSGIFSEILQPLVGFVANVYFFRLVLEGAIGLDRFIFLRGIISQASSSATSLSLSVQRLHELSINLVNFNEVIQTPPTIPVGMKTITRPLTIEFKNVSFTYPIAEKPSLNDVSFIIHPGSKLALVGENGAGKTTLLKLLLRQYLPTKGEILINGINIAEVEQASYYETISNLSQDYFLLEHLSIKDNLMIGIKHAPNNMAIDEAVKLVGADEFLYQLPKGLDTRLDSSFDDGTRLSGGQKQRLGVARALLAKGDVLILDEPTSAIDAKAEFSIFNNIYKAHEGKTTIIVSHRFSTVRKADAIIVIDKGKIVEYGSHQELIEHNGLYREMFELQAEGYK